MAHSKDYYEYVKCDEDIAAKNANNPNVDNLQEVKGNSRKTQKSDEPHWEFIDLASEDIKVTIQEKKRNKTKELLSHFEEMKINNSDTDSDDFVWVGEKVKKPTKENITLNIRSDSKDTFSSTSQFELSEQTKAAEKKRLRILRDLHEALNDSADNKDIPLSMQKHNKSVSSEKPSNQKLSDLDFDFNHFGDSDSSSSIETIPEGCPSLDTSLILEEELD